MSHASGASVTSWWGPTTVTANQGTQDTSVTRVRSEIINYLIVYCRVHSLCPQLRRTRQYQAAIFTAHIQ